MRWRWISRLAEANTSLLTRLMLKKEWHLWRARPVRVACCREESAAGVASAVELSGVLVAVYIHEVQELSGSYTALVGTLIINTWYQVVLFAYSYEVVVPTAVYFVPCGVLSIVFLFAVVAPRYLAVTVTSRCSITTSTK